MKKILYLAREYRFEAAHQIRQGEALEPLHGHSYRLRITVAGTPGPDELVVDFREVDEIVQERVLRYLDYGLINDIMPQPTAENLALWVWDRLVEHLKGENFRLFEVRVFETPERFVYYRGEEG